MLICLFFIACVEKEGEVKKESIEKIETISDKNTEKNITYKEIAENEDVRNFLGQYVTKEYDNIHDNRIDVIKDEFNNEMKFISLFEKKTDKIKLEIFESIITGDMIAKTNLYDTRGNISFICISKDGYFRFDKIILLTDKNRYIISGSVLSQDLDYENGKTIQTVKYVIDQEKYEMLEDMANSQRIRIRFTKNDNNKDFELSKEERQKIRDLYVIFNACIAMRDIFNEYLEKNQ